MNRTMKFIRNSVSTGILQVMTFILGLVTSRIMLSCYGSEINGLVSSINQFISYAKLVEAGLASAAVYALYVPLAQKDNQKVSVIVSSTNRYYIQTGYFFSGLIFVLALGYPYITDVNVLTKMETSILVLVLGLSGALTFFISAKYRALFTADQKQYILSYSTILSVILNTVVIVVCGKIFRWNIIMLKLMCTITTGVPVFIYIYYFKKHYKFLDLKTKERYKIGQRWSVFVNEIFGSIHFGSPIVIITFFCNLLEVSVFSVYRIVFQGINNICNSLILPMSASFGETLAIEDKKPFQRGYCEFEMAYYALSTIVYSCAFILILPFVSIYTKGVTDVDYLRRNLAFLFMLDAVLSNMYGPQAIIVRAGGFFQKVRNQTILQAVITISLGIPLTKMFGIQGMLIASCISNVVRIILITKLVHKQHLGISILTTVKRMILSGATIAIVIIPFIIKMEVTATNYFVWAAKAVPVTVSVAVVTLIFNYIFERETLIKLLLRLTNLIKNK